jgi:O-antigen ligase
MGHIRKDIERPAVWPPPVDHASVAAAVRYGRLRDPVGHGVHTALAVTYLFLLPLATTPKDAASALLLAWTCVRLPHIWACYAPLLRDRLIWLLAVWSSWHALSLLWSPDPAAGWDGFQAFRVLVVPLVLWPVLDRAPWLVAAFLAGVFAQNLVQAGQALEILGLEPGVNQRLPGLIHPIQTGAFCVAAMCWHLAALLNRTSGPRRRTVALGAASLIGLCAAAGGLIFSGSRGPWISAAIALPLCLLITGVRRPRARRAALVLAVIGLLGAAGAWVVGGDFVRLRVDQAITDVRAAAAGDYGSDVGHRLARWSAAWTVFVDSPIVGAGTGGYATAIERLGFEKPAESDHHAHSMYLQELATAGAIGALLLLAIIVLSIRRACKDPPDHPCADGTLWVLVSWLVGAQFDCYHLAGNMFALFALTVALTLPRRAAIR